MTTTDIPSLPVADLAEVTAAKNSTRPDLPIVAIGRQSGTGPRGRRRLGRFRRTLVSLALTTAAFLAVGLGGAAPASAEGIPLSIGMGCELQYYSWYWDSYWNGYSWVEEPVTVWLPCAGGGAWYCWHWSGSCWYEQWPWRLP